MTSAVTLLRDDDMGSLLLLCRALLALGQPNDGSGPTPRPDVRTLAACGGFRWRGASGARPALRCSTEREGFEPPDPCGSAAFKAAAINRTLPPLQGDAAPAGSRTS